MSTIKTNAHQIGIDGVTPANNFTLATPTIPDGTLSLYRGNVGVPIASIFTIDTNNNINFNNLPPCGQCKFQYTSTTVCTLVPFQGNLLNINGMNYIIPSAGVTLASGTLTASTVYNVYAYMVGATMTLEASTTGHSTSATNGMEIKTGDVTRSLVGKVSVSASKTFTWTVQNRLVLSWFNQRPTLLSGGFGAARNWGTSSWAELDGLARLTYLAWAGTAINFNITGAAQQNTAGAINGIGAAFNSGTVVGQANTQTQAAASAYYSAALSQTFESIEGTNFVTALCWISAGTGTFTLATSAMTSM
jgi:hypothetical protein